MKELDVRRLLYQTEIKRVLKENPASRVVNELEVLRGVVRVDVAVINDCLNGYEIKSASDNLERLPNQQLHYSKVFEKMTLVADERHVQGAVNMVPKHWGLIAIGMKGGKAYADEIWPARRNKDLDGHAIAQLLWREESLELLDYFGFAHGYKSKPRKVIWKAIAKRLTVEEIKAFACYKLRKRKDWKQGLLEDW